LNKPFGRVSYLARGGAPVEGSGTAAADKPADRRFSL
jgi:hypothetical protein